MPTVNSSFELSNSRSLLVLSAFLLLVYFNSFAGAWQMDDFPNILENPAIQMEYLDVASLKTAVGISHENGRNLARPVSNLSFALNWMIYGANPAGYHVVNFLIHLLAAWGVFLCCQGLLQTPNGLTVDRRGQTLIALTAAMLWALHPIQTQAVTYIVQRMASLSGAFYVWALYCYLRLRSSTSGYRLLWSLAIGLLYALAVGAKENALMLPAALLLSEIIFFQNSNNPRVRHRILLASGVVAGLIVGLAVVLLWSTDRDLSGILTRGYNLRPFTLIERLLTEPRIILFYLSLILFPIPSRFSIEHGIVISSDLWHPWTTFPALLIVIGGILIGVVCIRRYPFWAFAILFFFLNHTIESTILPLELVFEHRNYVPSMFLFLPVAIVLWRLKNQFTTKKPIVANTILVFIGTLILSFGFSSHFRNAVWVTPTALWSDAYAKAPNSARVAVNLAIEAAKQGHYETAINLYRHSLTLKAPRKHHFRILALNNMGGIYFRSGQYAYAAELYRQSLTIDPDNQKGRWNCALALLESRQFGSAENEIDKLLKIQPLNWAFLNLKGLLCILRRDPHEAIDYLKQSIKINPEQAEALQYIAIALSRMGYNDRSDWFFRQALQHDPNNIVLLIGHLENAIMSNDKVKTNKIGLEMLQLYDFRKIEAVLGRSPVEIDDPDAVMKWVKHHSNRAD